MTHSGLHILVVEDDPLTRAAITRMLAVGGHTIHTVSCADDALSALARQQFDVVISDHHLGGMNGVQLLELCKRSFPSVVRVLTTASNDFEVAARAVNQAAVLAIVRKPYRNQQLWSALGEATAARQMFEESRATIPQPFGPIASDAPVISAIELDTSEAEAIRGLVRSSLRPVRRSWS